MRPGFVRTPGLDAYPEAQPDLDAAAVLCLASPESCRVTRAKLVVGGGFTTQ